MGIDQPRPAWAYELVTVGNTLPVNITVCMQVSPDELKRYESYSEPYYIHVRVLIWF